MVGLCRREAHCACSQAQCCIIFLPRPGHRALPRERWHSTAACPGVSDRSPVTSCREPPRGRGGLEHAGRTARMLRAHLFCTTTTHKQLLAGGSSTCLQWQSAGRAVAVRRSGFPDWPAYDKRHSRQGAAAHYITWVLGAQLERVRVLSLRSIVVTRHLKRSGRFDVSQGDRLLPRARLLLSAGCAGHGQATAGHAFAAGV